jgi:spermidine/putrescine transport system substrate-binding protein
MNRAGSMAALALALLALGSAAHAEKLRIISWADYVPAEVIAAFKKETGIDVEVTLSNNEEMIAKLQASRGAGYDLAQPSQDRITGPQREFGIYKPIDMSQVKIAQFQPALLEIVRNNTMLDGKQYGLPYLWGTDGLVVNTKRAKVADYGDLCKPEFKGRMSLRLRRPTLMAFAFASGHDPFALYGDPKAYAALMEQVGATLTACKPNVRFYYDNKDQLLNGIRSGEIVAAMMWDTGGWTLNRENPDIEFIVPRSGALGWLDTFALPARGRNDAAAYAWINFTMRPDMAAKITKSVGNFTAAVGTEALVDARLKAQFAAAFPASVVKGIHWYPAIPPGLEELEGRVLDRIKAAN